MSYKHIDYTDELNVIIVALGRILDDVRVLRRRGEDASVGVVTNRVYNDFERAMILAGIAASEDAISVASEIRNPTKTSMDNGEATDPAVEEQRRSRADIISALELDETEERVIIRKSGLYYFEKEPEAGSWASYSSNPADRETVQGKYKFIEASGIIGYEDNDLGAARPGSPPSADKLNPSSPRARWPLPRPANRIIPKDDGISDLYNPITNTVPAQTKEEIASRSQDPNLVTTPVTEPVPSGTQATEPAPISDSSN